MSVKTSRFALVFTWASAMGANVLNWFFNLFLSHRLSLSEFAQVSVVLNSLVLLSTFALAFQYAITKYVPTLKNEPPLIRKQFNSTIFWLSLLVGVSLTLISLWLIPVWFAYLKLSVPPQTYFFISLSLLGLFISALVRGLLYGLRWYYLVSFAIIFESVTKLSITLVAAFTNPGIIFSQSFIAIALSLILPYFVFCLIIYLKSGLSFTFHLTWISRIFHFFLLSFTTTVSAQLLLFTDLIIVKHYFSQDLAGVYATLSLIGKMIFFFTTSIVALVAPEVSVRVASSIASTHILVKSIWFTSFIGIFSTLLFSLFPHYSLYLFLESAKVDLALPYVLVYGLAVTMISLVVIIFAYFVFLGFRYFVVSIILGLLSQWSLMIFFHQSIFQIVWVMFSVSLTTLALTVLGIFLEHRYLNHHSALPLSNS